ncbi:serpin family protein [Halobiforma nitratireducens]|uniref:Proteinase inhibitor I4 serpin n=1 Tax=Halobiforma nitratireducens JCM 10879 TaxID=1227454 RepID=M0MBW3_9EURY|nr:serpin family protein [Halobiforma nitratireducens]EMA41880.1 proteinase inhibitor I4 serpin [Halobiforma nitratireducens JCM 10879]
METDRRTLVTLTGALLAGAAGCTTDDDNDDPEAGTGSGSEESEAGNDGGNGFDESDTPEFPRIDPVTDPDLEIDRLAEQVRGNVAFSLDALGQLRDEQPDENVFFSPYSISVALAMTYAGARGETATEMATALRYELGDGGDADDLHAAFGALEDEFERRNEDGEEVAPPVWEQDEDDEDGDEPENEDDDLGFQLSSANAVWPDGTLPLDDEYLELLEAYYGAGEHVVDFTGDPEGAREEINAWVEDRTNDRIEGLLSEGDVDATTRLVLTNAVYFLAAWEHDFDPDATEPGTFTGLDGAQTEVDLMHQRTELRYAEIGGHQLVELPYANEETSMIVVLPAEGEFESFEESLTVDRLTTMLAETARPEVDLTIPKFGVESKFSLVETLEGLGMDRAFGSGADFSGMVEGDDSGLSIDDVIHQSFVEVDEEGTEAAAATAVVMDDAGPPDHVEMTVDRPFLFYIRDRPTETPLFVGRVVDGETLQDDQQ